MTASRFVEYCGNYYRETGNKELNDSLMAYLMASSDKYLDALLSVVLATYPREYPVCPGVAELKKCEHEALEKMYGKAPQDLTRLALAEAPEDDVSIAEILSGLVEKLSVKATLKDWSSKEGKDERA